MEPFVFPSLVTRVSPTLYHVTLLPSELPEEELLVMAKTQVLANRLQICLALSTDRAFYFDPDGTQSAPAPAPFGGILITGKLPLAVPCDETGKEFRARKAALAAATKRASVGYLLGDLTKGGHAATAEEQKRLKGVLADGTPRGLKRCKKCGDWKGVCLDPSPEFAGQVMTVHCFCDNHNRCARCQAQLADRRLNANFYDADERAIYHVPGFCGLNHRCTSILKSRAQVRVVS